MLLVFRLAECVRVHSKTMNATEATSLEDGFFLLRFGFFLSVFYAVLILFLYYLGNHLINRERAKYFDLG